jgi:acyl-CoA synthetase (AMP-forming)/AMP-acid ligase II
VVSHAAKERRAATPPAPAAIEDYASEKLMRQLERDGFPQNIDRFLAEQARRHADQPLLVFFEDGVTLTYRELDRRVTRLASSLARLGVGHGTHVGVMVFTTAHYPITWLALARLGAVTVPINNAYTSRELHDILTSAEAEFLVIDRELLGVFERMEASLLPRERVIVAGGEAPPYRQWETLEEEGTEDFVPMCAADQRDLMNIQYTSGTTGLPKGAMLPQLFWFMMAGVNAAQAHYRMRRVLIAQPFYYVDAQWLFLFTMIQGGTAWVARKQSASRFFGWLKEFRINYCNFPEVVSKEPEKPEDADNELMLILAYTHQLPNYRRHERRYGCLARQGFAMTEIGTGIYVPIEADHMTGTGTVGIPAAFREVMIADESGREVRRGALGEICVRGDGIFTGYYNAPEATAKAFHADGWFRTGDLGRQDRAGWFYFLGRIKDMVKRSGENVSAVEVECVLRGIPAVMEAAVLPVPDERRGEEVKAYLLLREGKSVDDLPPEAVLRHCEANLAQFKIPRYLEYVRAFPRTPSLKIKKSMLIAAKKDLRIGSYDRIEKIWR